MAYDLFQPPDEAEYVKLAAFLQALDAFRVLDPKIPATYIAAFLAVALKPGLGPSEYAKMIGTTQPVASRWLLEIGIQARAKAEPLMLVDRKYDVNNLRKQQYYLTPKGKVLFRQLMHIFRDK